MQRGYQPRHGDIEKARGRQGERVRQHPQHAPQSEIRPNTPQHRRQAGGHVQQQRAPLRHARMHEQREVSQPVRDLMGGDGERSHQPEGPVLQKGGCNENSVQHVVDAIADEHEHSRRLVAVRVVVSVDMTVIMGVVMTVGVLLRLRVTVAVPTARLVAPLQRRGPLPPVSSPLMRMSVPPQHHLLNDKKDAQPDDERNPNPMRAVRPNTLHGLRQKRQQRRAQQGPRSEAHEVRQEASAGAFRQEQKDARERGAGNTAERREHNDPTEQGHSDFFCLFETDPAIVARTSNSPPGPAIRQANHTSAAMRPHWPSRRYEKNRSGSAYVQ